MDDYAAYCADVVLELFEGAFPDLVSSEAEGCWVAVDDCSAEFVFAFEGEGFSWWGAVVGSVVELA